MCEDEWDLVDAEVVCKQFGYPGVVVSFRNSFFGEGPPLMLMTNLKCNGSELSLLDCIQRPFGEIECENKQNVGVLCGGKKLLLLFLNHLVHRVEYIHTFGESRAYSFYYAFVYAACPELFEASLYKTCFSKP